MEGRVVIDLPAHPGDTPSVRFSPPMDVTRLLSGKTPEEVLKIVPAVHGVCATAQTHAAVLALEGALEVDVPVNTLAVRQAMTMMECLREHLLRVAVDWPKLMDRAGDAETARSAMCLQKSFQNTVRGCFAVGVDTAKRPDDLFCVLDTLEVLLAGSVFGETSEGWLSRRGAGALSDWAAQTDTTAGHFISWLIENSRFGIAPLPPFRTETTSFCRRKEDPLLESLGMPGIGTRFVARLVELARLPGEIRKVLGGEMSGPGPVSSGISQGRGSVEASRGTLVHEVELADGLVSNYRIVPPTPLNFSEGGIALRCLNAIVSLEGVERTLCAHLVVHAVDPCVAYEVRDARAA